MKQLICLILCVSAATLCTYSAESKMKSPNGKITVELSDDGKQLGVYYGKNNVKAIDIVDLGMGIDGSSNDAMKYQGCTKPISIKTDYRMATGKKSHCTNQANEYTLRYTDGKGHGQNVIVRLYDNGVALRYEISGLRNAAITEDFTTYIIPEGTPRWIQKYTEAYEEFFPCTVTGEGPQHHWGYPALIESKPGTFVLIAESDIEKENSASSLDNSKEPTHYRVRLGESDMRHGGTFTSPWRVAMIGTLADIVESTLITDLAPESRLEDTEWIKPGSVSWVYWAYNHGSNDYQIVKKYIDLAAEMNWPYILIDAEWDEMGNGGNIEDAIKYAREKGVKPLVWYNSSTAWVYNGAPTPYFRLNKPEDRAKEYKWLKDIGVAGVKIDFFAGDTQPTMQYCIELLEDAAKYGLLVNFHGATIPRGWQRTYPNLMSVEGVYGAEWYNNTPALTLRAACHNATLPFTRNVVGPMDYTPCTFSDSQHPHITTNGHELALPVLYESALLHWADRPESYLAQPEQVRRMMSELPTVWDETRLLAGYPSLYAVIARRSGNTWWIAGINGTEEEKHLDLDLSKLNIDGNKTMTLYEDDLTGKNPWKITKLQGEIRTAFDLAPRGGFVAVIK